MNPKSTSKSVLITGASSGIGEATARLLAAHGHQLMLVARRDDRLRNLADELGDRVHWHRADVAVKEDMQAAAAAAIEKTGGIDVLVNNAGIMPLSPLAKGLVDEWDRMIDVNIKGVLYGIHAVLGHMLARGTGHIINISSLAGTRVMPNGAVYSGTKFAVRAITDGLRQETVGKLRATCILPGAFITELGNTISDTETLQAMGQRFKFKLGDPTGIAEAVRYAMEQPEDLSVNEIIVRPSSQPF